MTRRPKWSEVPALSRRMVIEKLESYAESYASPDSRHLPIFATWSETYAAAARVLREAARKPKKLGPGLEHWDVGGRLRASGYDPKKPRRKKAVRRP